MIEILSSPTHVQNGALAPMSPSQEPLGDVSGAAVFAARAMLAARQESNMMTREEHAALMVELNRMRVGIRSPRRAWSATDYFDESAGAQSTSQGVSPLATVTSSSDVAAEAAITSPKEPRPPKPVAPPQLGSQDQQEQAPRRRPALGGPRRSYSVMNYEPEPRTHRPSSRLAITDLPADIHFAIFDFLDPIDSTCFGLTKKHFYNIHKHLHGKIPLSSRRNGPNDLEWAWRGAGPLLSPPYKAINLGTTTNTLGAQDNALALERLRVKGQVYCRKCGIARCELHRHLREWMGEDFEYCSIKQKFGPRAPEDAKEFCHMSSPKNPHRCGRHRGKPKTPRT